MSFFGRMLASIGIGSAEVDTLLEKSSYAVGEEVRGAVRMRGGQVDQSINAIYMTVMTEFLRETDNGTHRETAEVARYLVSDPFTLKAGDELELPFSFPLPDATPVSVGRIPVWIRTNLDISSAVDPTDNDRIEVTPHPAMRAVLDAVDSLGFRLYKTDCEYAPRLGGGLPFVQEFEYKPSGRYAGRLDELEVVLRLNGSRIDVYLQVDRRARGLSGLFAEAMNMDESVVRLSFEESEWRAGSSLIAGQIEQVLQRYS
ncbi:sporulation protein [Paenibacillus turpanensis]|uniref:sporulation protein n=1 Tax=Paenibacillus turpanensis TaxID=2689078 RepID=UPI001407817D|nr:sporulation protein [Paenibacillus turpanensis]